MKRSRRNSSRRRRRRRREMAGVKRAGVVQSEASTGGAEYLRPLPRVTSCDSPHPSFSTRLESPPPPTSTTTIHLLPPTLPSPPPT